MDYKYLYEFPTKPRITAHTYIYTSINVDLHKHTRNSTNDADKNWLKLNTKYLIKFIILKK